MKKVLPIILTLTFCFFYGISQSKTLYHVFINEIETMDSFINSNEFKIIENSLKKINSNASIGIWVNGIHDSAKKESSGQNEYRWGDEDCSNVLFKHSKYLIFSYHLSAGSNTGTLIFDRKTSQIKIYGFNSDQLDNNNLSITREGYNKGHWWQSGILNLNTNKITWNKNIDR
jgi:hypothetical protein